MLVTGGAGFIGANLCRTLLATGEYDITVVDNLSTGYRSNLDGLDVRFLEGSILDRDLLAEATPEGGRVVHLAALGSVPRSVADPLASHEVNSTGTLNTLEAARHAGVTQVILASSSSVYGDNEAPAKHELLPVAPKSPYGATKLFTESAALAHQRTYGMGVLAFRFFNVFGPLQAAGHAYAAVIPSFIDRAINDQPVIVHGDGRQSRDFTYVASVCETILDALRRSVTFDGPVNLAHGGRFSLLEIIELISAELDQPIERDHVESRPGDIKHSKADPTRLQALFPEVTPVDVACGIGHTVSWFRSIQNGS